ncbi:cyclin-dependent kinase 9-like [Octopus sinensis]|uniref:Cyclin-dependent kinase 9-like n=1 Tax=Octopus sinensis TaxID=2607531 RepID=A0A7E6EK66_9MOLL|nr:cyclin-dependent kinase 9-like [Octopus sinensis]
MATKIFGIVMSRAFDTIRRDKLMEVFKSILDDDSIRMIAKQLLEGLHYLHYSHILHRDIKAANILISKNGVLKVADFGLARACKQLKPNQGYTNRVVTLWYRPPELLLGEKIYTTAVDIWGVGCIIAELFTRSPIMQGSNEIHQMKLIIKLLGPIDPSDWPEASSLRHFKSMSTSPSNVSGGMHKQRLKYYISDPSASDLVDKMLVYNPAKRFDCAQALEDDYFYVDPKPMCIANTLALHGSTMFEFLAPNRRGNPITQNHPKRETVSGVVYDRVY